MPRPCDQQTPLSPSRIALIDHIDAQMKEEAEVVFCLCNFSKLMKHSIRYLVFCAAESSSVSEKYL